jgi:hypothetical protein
MAGRSRPARRRAWAAAAAAAAGGCLLAGCSSAPAPAPAAVPSAATAPLATSLVQAGGQAWAIVAMGGSAADDSFWEVFTRPLGSSQWALVTPPGVADNGGLVAAVPPAAQGLDVAVRPSQNLTFSPLALTGNGGKTWNTGLVDASVAAVPGALALGGGRMLVLLTDGAIDQASSAATAWTRLAAPGAIAGSAAGRDCHVTALTAVSLTAAGTPLVGASCARPGVAGIFTQAGGSWQATGPSLTGRLAGEPVRVLRIAQFSADSGTGTGAGTMALLQAGSGDGDRGPASLLAAWTTDGTHWTLSPPLPVNGAQVLSSGAGPGSAAAWVLLAGGRAATIAGPGVAWYALPALPHGTAVLATGPGGVLNALAVSGNTALTVFQMTPAGAWQQAQVISVPVQLGSSS